jgi:FkbM family methyltransferase
MVAFLPTLKKNGHLDGLRMTICNVGSRKVRERDDYGSHAWSYFAPALTIYGFEADEDACEQANAENAARSINWIEKHFPLALSDKVGTSALYVTENLECTSLYSPNDPYISRFINLPDFMQLNFVTEIQTTTLDQVCQSEGIQEIDFLQVDVQGADLDVLKGASDILSKSILALEIEVEFSALYTNQPLFAEVDIFLRSQYFTLFDVTKAYRHRLRSPFYSNTRPGQLLWGDAIYMRDLIGEQVPTSRCTPTQILKLACIADILDLPDYALELLEYLTLNYAQDQKQFNCANVIFESLSQFPELASGDLSSLPVIKNIYDYLS